jgi:hypothetical protein
VESKQLQILYRISFYFLRIYFEQDFSLPMIGALDAGQRPVMVLREPMAQ